MAAEEGCRPAGAGDVPRIAELAGEAIRELRANRGGEVWARSAARPDPLDVALAIERINEATTLDIRSVRSEWAGLRTFAPDRNLVVGPDPAEPAFFWSVGQGGTGIQAAPATAELLAAMVRGDSVPSHIEETGLDLEELSPARPALGRSRLASR